MAEKIYSEIPMRTWRWLGVNEARGEETVDLPSQDVRVAAGEVRELTVAYRQEGQSSLRARVEAGGVLKLTTVQLVPGSGFFGGDIETDSKMLPMTSTGIPCSLLWSEGGAAYKQGSSDEITWVQGRRIVELIPLPEESAPKIQKRLAGERCLAEI